MRICVLNSLTKVCENVINLDDASHFVPYKPGIELAPVHDGEIGWTWGEHGWTNNQQVITEEIKAFRVRTARDAKLKNVVDKINPLKWESMTAEDKQKWLAYRQALLDIPQQPGFPWNVIWPIQPD